MVFNLFDAKKEQAREAFVAKKKLDREDQEFRKFMVPGANSSEVEKEKAFIVFFPPLLQTRSPFSSATRPMLAFDLKTKKLVVMILKDYWRPNVADIEKEGDVYEILPAHKVDYIAEFGTGNDVRDHFTRTQEFINKGWALRRRPQGGEALVLTPLRQYCMTLLVIGEPLTNFKSSKQFVSAIADAMKAHDDAYLRLIYFTATLALGTLSFVAHNGSTAQTNGNMAFMSIHLLREQLHYHDIEDDRESALYVLLWTALRYTKHIDLGDIKGSNTKDLLAAFDEVRPDDNEQNRGGSSKYVFLGSQTKLRFDGRPQLDDLFSYLRQAFLLRYQTVPVVRDQDPFLLEVLRRHNAALENLRKENWLVSVIQEYLAMEGWPSDDKAEPQETVIQVTTSHKRGLDQEKINDRNEKRFRSSKTQ
ncbi:hypothetical protein BJ912DRAFT_1146841 [Pholiota molesta]|nr:hypothetical protein BJ912DRAFT_1146841 [Pholiota molesta]